MRLRFMQCRIKIQADSSTTLECQLQGGEHIQGATIQGDDLIAILGEKTFDPTIEITIVNSVIEGGLEFTTLPATALEDAELPKFWGDKDRETWIAQKRSSGLEKIHVIANPIRIVASTIRSKPQNGQSAGSVAISARATLFHQMSFEGTTFNGLTGFEGATFSEDAVFRRATFGEAATFSGAAFGGEANFGGATFTALAVTHQRRHRWLALCCRLCASAHTTVILHTVWCGWPLDERDVVLLAFFGVSVLVGLGWLGWSLRGLRQAEAADRRWTLQHVRWQAQDRAGRAVGGA
jgi:Pentapeptide repeats (9 copies)